MKGNIGLRTVFGFETNAGTGLIGTSAPQHPNKEFIMAMMTTANFLDIADTPITQPISNRYISDERAKLERDGGKVWLARRQKPATGLGHREDSTDPGNTASRHTGVRDHETGERTGGGRNPVVGRRGEKSPRRRRTEERSVRERDRDVEIVAAEQANSGARATWRREKERCGLARGRGRTRGGPGLPVARWKSFESIDRNKDRYTGCVEGSTVDRRASKCREKGDPGAFAVKERARCRWVGGPSWDHEAHERKRCGPDPRGTTTDAEREGERDAVRAALCDSCNWLPTGLQRVPLSFIRADTGATECERSGRLARPAAAAVGQGRPYAARHASERDESGERRGGYVKITRAMRETRVRRGRIVSGRPWWGAVVVGEENGLEIIRMRLNSWSDEKGSIRTRSWRDKDDTGLSRWSRDEDGESARRVRDIKVNLVAGKRGPVWQSVTREPPGLPGESRPKESLTPEDTGRLGGSFLRSLVRGRSQWRARVRDTWDRKDESKEEKHGQSVELEAAGRRGATKNTVNNATKDNDRPLYPPRFIKTIILNNPFSDIIPRILVQESEEVKDSSKIKTAGVKDFNLLSFGKEAEEDDEESVILNKKFSAVEPPGPPNKKREKSVIAIGKVMTKLRSCGRGLIAMANAGEDDTGSQFFFTLGSQLDLQNKHSIFGYVTGETIYDMLELEEAVCR
ncbi:Peptidyl-prolyl cis-trans isomerase CWC27 like protein [Eufriesea mexicana]|nr:Peptidyl-prolyl cis-trans isomerase CWC27 like protein [Eufriesea mexicana]